MTADGNKARAVELLRDEVALWLTTQGGPADLIAAACDVIVAGADSPAVVDLAGRSSRESSWIIAEVAAAVLEELHVPPLQAGSEDAVAAACLAMCRRFLSGTVSARELARWAHRTIAHEGPAALQGLVNLDDDYDVAEHADADVIAMVDAAVEREAASLMRERERPR